MGHDLRAMIMRMPRESLQNDYVERVDIRQKRHRQFPFRQPHARRKGVQSMKGAQFVRGYSVTHPRKTC